MAKKTTTGPGDTKKAEPQKPVEPRPTAPRRPRVTRSPAAIEVLSST